MRDAGMRGMLGCGMHGCWDAGMHGMHGCWDAGMHGMRRMRDFTISDQAFCMLHTCPAICESLTTQPLEAMQVEEVASLALATSDSYTQLVSLSRHLLVSFALVSLAVYVDYSSAGCALVERRFSSCFGA